MKTEHTPGPWTLVENEHDDGVGIYIGQYRNIRAGRGYLLNGEGFDISSFMTHEDAALITAAPDLLEALESVTDRIELWQKGVAEGVEIISLIAQAKEAIAKARS